MADNDSPRAPAHVADANYAEPTAGVARTSLSFLDNRSALVQRYLLAELLAPPVGMRRRPSPSSRRAIVKR